MFIFIVKAWVGEIIISERSKIFEGADIEFKLSIGWYSKTAKDNK
jgi:hypothetical protein